MVLGAPQLGAGSRLVWKQPEHQLHYGAHYEFTSVLRSSGAGKFCQITVFLSTAGCSQPVISVHVYCIYVSTYTNLVSVHRLQHTGCADAVALYSIMLCDGAACMSQIAQRWCATMLHRPNSTVVGSAGLGAW